MIKLQILRRIFLIFILGILILYSNYTSYAIDNPLKFTKKEQDFIEQNPIIYLAVDPQFVPFEFIENNKHMGIAADYLELISKLTGLQFKAETGLSWNQGYEKALNRELDALPAIGKNVEREKDFIFSKPYYNFKRAIVINNKNKQIAGISDLKGVSVAVQENSSHHGYLLEYSDINISLYDNVESALVAVSTGEEIAYIGNLATIDYLIHNNGITNLRLISFESEKDQALYFASHKDKPELISIFNKALNHISEEEKLEIKNKWINLDTNVDKSIIRSIIIRTLAISALVLLISVFWIIRLRDEIARRKKIQAKLEFANMELEKISMMDGLTGISNRRYFDNFMGIIWDINKRENFPLSIIMIDIDHFKYYNDSYYKFLYNLIFFMFVHCK